jgi:hypothetical protein
MLVWTHEDLFYFPTVTTAEDFANLMVATKDRNQVVQIHRVSLQRFPSDESLLKKLSDLFPDPRERDQMLGEDGLPSHTWVCLPLFGSAPREELERRESLQQQILSLFKTDFVRADNVPGPDFGLLEGCVKRFCDSLSGRAHEHGYRAREEDWWVP